jgi:hypothetical protein
MRDYLKKNEPVDKSKIIDCINSYHHTIHMETGVSPIQMQIDKALEVE